MNKKQPANFKRANNTRALEFNNILSETNIYNHKVTVKLWNYTQFYSHELQSNQNSTINWNNRH